MTITICGIIWLCIALICFLYKDIFWMISFTLFSMALQCVNIIYIGGSGIGPQILSSIFLLIRLMFYSRRMVDFKENSFLISVIFIFIIILTTIVNVGFKFDKFVYILQLIIYIFTYLQIKRFNLIDNSLLYKLLKRLSIFLIIMGIIQISINLNIVPKFKLITELFYNDNSTNIAYNKDYYDRICSTFMEPSYFAPVLLAIICYFYLKKNKNIVDWIILFLSLIELIFTKSSTAYVGLILIFILYIIFTPKTTSFWNKIIPTIFLLSISLFFISTTTNFLDIVIFSKKDGGSYAVRTLLNNKAYDAFILSPIIGVGYKEQRASSLFFQLLAEIGLLGTIAYFLMFIEPLKDILKKGFPYGWMVLSALICQIIAIPDIDICSTWLVIYIYALSKNTSDLFNKSGLRGNNL